MPNRTKAKILAQCETHTSATSLTVPRWLAWGTSLDCLYKPVTTLKFRKHDTIVELSSHPGNLYFRIHLESSNDYFNVCS
jgi:hypothetical protein